MLLSITSAPDLSLSAASAAAKIVRRAAHPEEEIIFGASVDEDMSEEVWITVIATRFDNAFASRNRRDRGTESRELRRPDRGSALRPERTDADLLADWRAMPHVRHGSADELYGDGNGGVGLDRRPPEPRSIENRVLDVPEFEPDQ